MLGCIVRKGLAFVVNAYERKGKAFCHAAKKVCIIFRTCLIYIWITFLHRFTCFLWL